ncbi:MDM12 (YOL009C) [Zygosaccharomyces parabailii]|uniref:Mitochondrial distribution and morphology protein 12 n=1 Tax=Zygosaccharomyces bailii (strain CLIB 213 / ATCC 58445 / CBS 680 / BCRC 21525 / NBRC 1098 / NCYC 1416 / NRRL Y-2227) TaxID=1333698 RepID=A0A8J2T5J0_ZYGB2|nr:MDM12 (YOL009C) [Zygosaccharomyces parabailii]CDF89426.1 ZYBA0S04-04060g1_1 [Zygosaccharomyces bailii CLIB 213]CDH13552.1 probable Mitochondrial distribution and morphology protein 12 [Zygosaccharomyces bailii ISA1307]SJM85848.1 probable Mitochondrial distribution and morphology protein 12 [Zygosaccharomyces bailii]
MSFDIDWSNVESDTRLNQSIKNHLNMYLGSITLPSYVCNLRILDFSLGKIAPNITLREISDPLDEFYRALNEQETEDDDGGEGSVKPSPSDIQFLVETEYKGDLLVTLAADLVLNYPSDSFMKLPVKLTISNVGLHSLCLVAYLSKHLLISFLCDISDSALDGNESILDPQGRVLSPRRSLERISIIRSMKIETEIGQQFNGEGSVLRSVGRLEQFLLELFKNLLRKEVSWPSWIELDFNEDKEE